MFDVDKYYLEKMQMKGNVKIIKQIKNNEIIDNCKKYNQNSYIDYFIEILRFGELI